VSSSSRDERDLSADAQLHLVRVLSGMNLPGVKDDLSKLDDASQQLRDRRRDAVASHWPAIPMALSGQFDELFETYAKKSASPTQGAQADARGFLRHLSGIGKLPDRLAVTLLKEATSNWPLNVARLRERRGVALAIRFPRIGVRVWSLALPGKRA
jgi:hypothetical protein